MTKVLVTGGTGCIGAATILRLLNDGADDVLVATRTSDPGTLGLWLGDDLDPRVRLVKCDLEDHDGLSALVKSEKPSHVIHLAAFQSPDCDSYPDRGMQINVGGTQVLLNAIRDAGGAERVVFASSAAVYGKRSIYPGATVLETDTLQPPNLYGIWKVAGEHLCRLFQEQTGIPTVCLRLNTTYGKGRDRGKTAAPTTAMKTIAQGRREGTKLAFRMPYQGRENYHYVEDVGAHFAMTCLQPFEGFGAFNIRGRTIEVTEFLTRIEAVAAELGLGDHVDLGIEENAAPNLFVCDLDEAAIQSAFENLPSTPVDDGIRETLQAFTA